MNADHKYFIKKIWKHTDVYNYLMLQITNSAHSAYSAQWVGTCHFTHMSLAGDTGSDCSGMTCAVWGVKILSDDILEICWWHLDPIKPLAMHNSHHFDWSYGIANTLSAPYFIAWKSQSQQSTARLPDATGEQLWRPGSSYGRGLCWGKNSTEGPGWPARHPSKPSKTSVSLAEEGSLHFPGWKWYVSWESGGYWPGGGQRSSQDTHQALPSSDRWVEDQPSPPVYSHPKAQFQRSPRESHCQGKWDNLPRHGQEWSIGGCLSAGTISTLIKLALSYSQLA